jgi:hypothetical protein
MLDLVAIFDPDGGATPAFNDTPAINTTPADLPAEWFLMWDERAAIREYDGGLPRERAEALALAEILEKMRQTGSTGENHDPVREPGC